VSNALECTRNGHTLGTLTVREKFRRSATTSFAAQVADEEQCEDHQDDRHEYPGLDEVQEMKDQRGHRGRHPRDRVSVQTDQPLQPVAHRPPMLVMEPRCSQNITTGIEPDGFREAATLTVSRRVGRRRDTPHSWP
jgi:hypothetical protein